MVFSESDFIADIFAFACASPFIMKGRGKKISPRRRENAIARLIETSLMNWFASGSVRLRTEGISGQLSVIRKS
jgi:hypothetical protein